MRYLITTKDAIQVTSKIVDGEEQARQAFKDMRNNWRNLSGTVQEIGTGKIVASFDDGPLAPS